MENLALRPCKDMAFGPNSTPKLACRVRIVQVHIRGPIAHPFSNVELLNCVNKDMKNFYSDLWIILKRIFGLCSLASKGLSSVHIFHICLQAKYTCRTTMFWWSWVLQGLVECQNNWWGRFKYHFAFCYTKCFRSGWSFLFFLMWLSCCGCCYQYWRMWNMVCLSSFYDKSFPDSYACKHVVVLLTKKSTYSIDVQFLPKVHSEMMLLSLVKPSLTESIVCHSFTPQFAITKYLLPNLYLSKSTLDRNDNQL